MTRVTIEQMTVDQLRERFTEIALAQDKAVRVDDSAAYNRLFRQMEAIEDELARRDGDQRRELLPLLDHANAQIRLKAALATLSVAPEVARRTLQRISDRQEYPQAADARGMMRALDEGTYVPR